MAITPDSLDQTAADLRQEHGTPDLESPLVDDLPIAALQRLMCGSGPWADRGAIALVAWEKEESGDRGKWLAWEVEET
jgi:hypothetical protein